MVALCVMHAAATVPLLCLPCLLLLRGETAGGRLVGGAFVLVLVASLCLWLLWSRKTRLIGGVLVGGAVFASFVCLGGAVARAPAGAVPDGNFRQVHTGNAAFRKFALPNIVPEIDQLKLGSYLFGVLDPFIGPRKGKRVRRLFLDVYREMRQDARFVEAGSALGMCYEDIFTGRRRLLHFYAYVPRHLERESYPVLIFLHGSLGNFKGYTWVLKELADAEGCAVIAPTYGCGNWFRDRDCAVLNAVHQHCVAEPSLDHTTVWLAGLSNGGTGVTRAVRDHGGRYRGVVLISPVLERDITGTPGFVSNAAAKPFLIIHGEEDRRIPASGVRRCEAVLRHGGADVASHYYPGEDHFLLFSQRVSVVRNIADFLRMTR